jgi:hypothetical protein
MKIVWGTVATFACRDWGTPRTASARIAGLRVLIATPYFPNTMQECHPLQRDFPSYSLPVDNLTLRSHLHAIRKFDAQCTNISKIEDTWWWPYTAETCSVEEGWLDNKLHLRRKYMWNKWCINATGCLNTLGEEKHWVHPFFYDSVNGGAYIVSKELNSDPISI